MCTLAFSLRVHRRWPIVVAANRDERLRRAAEGWGLREGPRGIRYAAPRDLLAGGTWIGVSARGLFAAVTNVHVGSGGFPDPRRRSRGELVGKALEHGSAAEAAAALSAGDAAAYNPFHLVVADADGAFLWRYGGEAAGLEELGPGLHVVTEQSHEDRGPRGELVRARWPLEADPGRLLEVLTLHGPGLEATCVHADPEYGTRSSAVLRLAPSLSVSELYVTDGRPCASQLEDRSRLLQALALPSASS